MPCLTPYRGDTSQMLLFKIASCLEASGAAGASVLSFNGRTGNVILSLADVAAVADGRYVLKAGDTMTGALVHPDGTAALPSITFTGDLDTGIFHPAADTLAFSTLGLERVRISSTGFVGIGTTPTVALEIWSSSAMIFNRYTASDSQGSFLQLSKSNSAVVGTSTLNPNADAQIAKILFAAANGVGFTVVAGINVNTGVGGHTSSADMPAYMAFTTTPDGTATPIERMRITESGSIGIGTLLPSSALTMAAGLALAFNSGVNQRAGDAVLIAGTVTVANTSVTANTRVFVSRKTNGGVPGTSFTYTLIAATSFTITSSNVADTSTVSYLLIEVP